MASLVPIVSLQFYMFYDTAPADEIFTCVILYVNLFKIWVLKKIKQWFKLKYDHTPTITIIVMTLQSVYISSRKEDYEIHKYMFVMISLPFIL